MKTDVTIQAGELLTFSTGEYSDYSVHGVFRALKSFDVGTAMLQYVKAVAAGETRASKFYIDEAKEWLANPYEDLYVGDEGDFLGWLARHGYIEDVPSRELHLGSYGRLALRRWTQEF